MLFVKMSQVTVDCLYYLRVAAMAYTALFEVFVLVELPSINHVSEECLM